MPKRNLFAKLNNPSSDIPLRPFDLSQRKLYSSRAGMCVPTLALTCVKGDKFRINPTVFNRTDRLLAPAFFRCKQFYHFFFVPYHTLWHEWDSFYTRSSEKLSSATLGNSYFPNFDIDAFMHTVESGGISLVGYDMMGYNAIPGIDRMMQMLHYSDLNAFDDQQYTQGTPLQRYCNLARILAYNKIWYWFYRDKRHSPSSSWFQDFVKYYNVDDINCSTFANSHVDIAQQAPRLLEMFKPKYRTWDSDLFTNSFVSTQFGNISVVDSTASVNIVQKSQSSYLADGQNVGLKQNSAGQFVQGVYSPGGTYITGSANWQLTNLFDILSLRRAEAIQHWRELMLRAGDSSKDRYRAMFGSNPKRSEEIPNYIGGFDVNLNIDDVTSNSIDNGQTTDGLGQLAGKGIMVSNNNTIEFTCPDYGILMCISSILPLSEYDGTCIDRDNQLIEPTDFYIPQFDRLGFEPITLGEWTSEYDYAQSPYLNNTVVGYSVRNHYLKTAVDRVYNNFRFGKSEQYWSCVRDPLMVPNPNIGYSFSYRQYYISPNIINPLFDRHCLMTTSSPDLAYNEDQFKCMVYFDIKALRPMSELGLPPL